MVNCGAHKLTNHLQKQKRTKKRKIKNLKKTVEDTPPLVSILDSSGAVLFYCFFSFLRIILIHNFSAKYLTESCKK